MRPEKIRLWDGVDRRGFSRVSGTVLQVVYLGSISQLIIRLRTGETVVVHQLNADPEGAVLQGGQPVAVEWAGRHSYLIGTGEERPGDGHAGARGPDEGAAAAPPAPPTGS